MGGTELGIDKALGDSKAHDLTVPLVASSKKDLEQKVKARVSDLALGFVTGEGQCRGRTDVRASRVVRIEGLGTRFSGNYYVSTVVHTFTRCDGYATRFTVQRNAL
jgi:phage protein D